MTTARDDARPGCVGDDVATGGTCFSAPVEHGSARGKGLGFPTANLGVDDDVAASLCRGVFVARVCLSGGEQYGAVLNIGVRPTFDESALVVEIHILDFSADLYGETLEVTVLTKLRDEKRFADHESLVDQIERDIKMARAALK